MVVLALAQGGKAEPVIIFTRVDCQAIPRVQPFHGTKVVSLIETVVLFGPVTTDSLRCENCQFIVGVGCIIAAVDAYEVCSCFQSLKCDLFLIENSIRSPKIVAIGIKQVEIEVTQTVLKIDANVVVRG